MNKHERIVEIDRELRQLYSLVDLVYKEGCDYEPNFFTGVDTGGFSTIEIRYKSKFSKLLDQKYAWNLAQTAFLPVIQNRIRHLTNERKRLEGGFWFTVTQWFSNNNHQD